MGVDEEAGGEAENEELGMRACMVCIRMGGEDQAVFRSQVNRYSRSDPPGDAVLAV